jgi:hypothetical protein
MHSDSFVILGCCGRNFLTELDDDNSREASANFLGVFGLSMWWTLDRNNYVQLWGSTLSQIGTHEVGLATQLVQEVEAYAHVQRHE